MSELEDEIERLRSRNADLVEILEAVERESGWVPNDTPLPEFIRQLRKERDELKPLKDALQSMISLWESCGTGGDHECFYNARKTLAHWRKEEK